MSYNNATLWWDRTWGMQRDMAWKSKVPSPCVFLRCPVSVWRASRSPPLPSTALESRAPKQKSAASPTTWQSWATLKRSSFPNGRGIARKAQMEPQVSERKHQTSLQVCSSLTVHDNVATLNRSWTVITGQLFTGFYSAEQLKGKGPKLKCNYCDKIFAKNFDLQQHIRRWVTGHKKDDPMKSTAEVVIRNLFLFHQSHRREAVSVHRLWPSLCPKVQRQETHADTQGKEFGSALTQHPWLSAPVLMHGSN